MPASGVYYWQLGGYYSSGIPVDAPVVIVGVNMIRAGQGSELSLEGDFHLNILPGSLPDNTWVSVIELPESAWLPLNCEELDALPRLPEDVEHVPVSPAYSLSPAALKLSDPATLTLTYDVEKAGEEPVGIYYLRNGSWVYVGGVTDPCRKTISAGIIHLGYYNAMSGAPGDIAPDLLIPAEFKLHQNYPNPFNPVTTIGFDLPRSSNVSLIVYDMLGRQAARLIESRLPYGVHRAVWDGRNDAGIALASGVYIVQLRTDGFSECSRMILVK